MTSALSYYPPLLGFLLVGIYAVPVFSQQPITFNEDCSDPNLKEVVCSIKRVDCNADTDLITKASNSKLLPDEAHDLRVDAFSKTKSLRNDAAPEHQLDVTISWQTPPNNATRLLKGFLLEIDGESGQKHECFLFNVTGSDWTPATIAHSPRLHFSTDSPALFKFSQNYAITVYSLPESETKSNSVQRRFNAPHNPNLVNLSDYVAANCTKFSHPYASKWTAGFRHIYIHSVARKMQVEFLAAPSAYCFEQYEVRLLDETATELLHSGTVGVEELRKEVFPNNVTITYGVYNFTNLEYDRVYIPSVMPVERSGDGRCLCPVKEDDSQLSDVNKMVCSCIAAEWKPVRINRLDVVQGIDDTPALPMVLPNAHQKPVDQHQQGKSNWIQFFILNFIFCIAVCVFLLYYHGYCRRIMNPKQPAYTRRIRFVREPKENGDVEMLANGVLPNNDSSVHLTAVGIPSSTSSLLLSPQFSVLIVYNHDSLIHEEAVLALAVYLRDVYNLKISLDCWDTDRIEMNLIDYVTASVLDANKVILVNSLGARERYMAKVMHKDFSIERDHPELYDKIYLQQIDMVLQHPCIINARFTNTSQRDTLPQFTDCLNYSIPDNMAMFISSIFGRNMKQDSRLTGQLPQLVKLEEKVQQMVEYCSNNPSWFVETHHKRIQKQVKPSASSDSTMTTIVDVEPATTTTTIENGPVSEQSVAAGGCDVETAATIVLGDTGAQKEEEEIVAAPMATSDESTKQHDSGIDVSMPQQCNSIATQQEETTSDAQHNGTMEETTTTAEYVNGEGKEQQAPVKSPVQQNGIVMESSEHSESKEASDRHQVPPPLDSGVFEWSSTMNGGGVIDDSEHHLIPNGNKHNNNNSSNGHLLKNGYIPPNNNNNKHHPNPHSHHMMLPKMGSSAVVKKDKRKQQRGAKTNHNYNNNNNAKEGSRHLEKEEEEATMDSGFNDHRVEADRPLISNNS